MKIQSIRLQNFRSYRDHTIDFGTYACLVGANGSGKSAVLAALNVFFRNADTPTNTAVLQEEDFYLRNTSSPVVITVTFTDLSPDAQADLSAYVRHGKLVVSVQAEWDAERRRAEVKQFGSRLVMPAFAGYFRAEADGSKAADLKEIYEALRASFPELSKASSKADMASALRSYEESRPERCELVASEDQFYGWSKGLNRLAQHCQWVYIPAVKDPTEEQQEGKNTALGQLLQRSIRSRVDFSGPIASLRDELGAKYQALIASEQDVLLDLAKVIERRLREWAHPGANLQLQWHYDDQKTVVVNEPLARVLVGEGPFTGELARLGHGLQRAFLISVLHELASSVTAAEPTLILGFEEPELYQHPPQVRHLSTVLERLSEGNAQIILTTHSPYFISGRGFENVILTRKLPHGETRTQALTYTQLSERLASALEEPSASPTSVMAAVEQIIQPSQSELFFSTVPILVEGNEDIAYLATHLQLSGRWAEFRRMGCHFVVCSGKNCMSRPLAIAYGLGLPAFVVFDADADDLDPGRRNNHRRDNRCILNLAGETSAEPLPDKHFYADGLVMWSSNIGTAVRQDIGEATWGVAEARARQEHGLVAGVSRKHPLLIAATLEDLWRGGTRSAILEDACGAVLAHARRVQQGQDTTAEGNHTPPLQTHAG